MNKIKLDIQKFASVQTTKYEGRYLKLTVTETATSIENNTSTITWLFESIGGESAYYTIYNWSVKVAGQQIYETTTTNWSSEKFPAKKGSKSGTLTINHKADGTADPVSFTLTGKVYSSGTASFTGSLNLTTIPRASTPTIGAVTLGSPVTITTNRASDSFTHTLTYTFGNATGTIATGVGASTSWTPALSLSQQIPNATAGAGIITCTTYNGSTLIGTKEVPFTASVPSSVVPSISLSTPTIGGSAPASWGIFVKGKSTANYTITGTGAQGSTISQYQSSVAGYSYTTANVTTGILYSAGTQTISAKVIDSRGRQATTSRTFNVVDYYNPSFTTTQIQRVDANGNLDENGQYAKFNFAGSVSSCSGNNKGTYKIAYRVKNTGSYTEKTIATNAQSISQSGFITSDGTQSGTKIQFSNNQSYDIKFMITDAFGTQENLQTLDTGFDLMNFNDSGQSMAIGKVSTRSASERYLDVGLNLNLEGKAERNGIPMPYLFKVFTGGSTSGRYYKIATIPASDNSKHTSIAIKGPIGGWINTKLDIDLIIKGSGGFTAYANGTGQLTALDYVRIEAYQESGDYWSVYLHTISDYTTNQLEITLAGNDAITLFDGSTYTTAPTGTKIWETTKYNVGPYPIGAIYMSVQSTNPGTFLGGTWERIAQGRTLMGEGVVQANSDNWCGTITAGDWTAYAGLTGGEVFHTLTTNEIPAHTHGRKTLTGQWRSKKARFPGSSERSGIITEWEANQATYWSSGGGTDTNTVGWKIDASHEHNSVGGGARHNNMPPYLVVYIWKRTG